MLDQKYKAKMAPSTDDMFVTSLIFDYLSKKNASFAQIFRKMTNAITLSKGSPTIADVVSHYRKTAKNKLSINPTDRKKSSSDSSSESEAETPVIKTTKTLLKSLLNGNAGVNLSKKVSRDYSSDDEFSNETVVSNKSQAVSSKKVTTSKTAICSKKKAETSDSSDSDEETAVKTPRIPKNQIGKKVAKHSTTLNSTTVAEEISNVFNEDELPTRKFVPLKDIATKSNAKLQISAKPTTSATASKLETATACKVKPKIPTVEKADKSGEKTSSSEESSEEEAAKPLPRKSTFAKTATKMPSSKGAVILDQKSHHSDSKSSSEDEKSTATPVSNTEKSVIVRPPASLKKSRISVPAKQKNDDEDSSDEETEQPPAKKPTISTSKNFPQKSVTGDNSSDSSEEDDSDKNVTKLPKKTNSVIKKKVPTKSETETDSEEDEEEKIPKSNPLKRKIENDYISPSPKQKKYPNFVEAEKLNDSINGDDKCNREHSEPFRRTIAEEVQVDENLKRQNSQTKRGSFGSWGDEAAKVLVNTRGKEFRYEKMKKKRGTYTGGFISKQVNSTGFD